MTTPCLRVFVALLVISAARLSHSVDWQWSAPDWAAQALERAGIGLSSSEQGLYIVATHVNPFVLFGDFDGDQKTDVAVLVREKASSKVGIAVARQSGPVDLLGAGKILGNGGDDFSWLDHWYTFTRGPVPPGASEQRPPELVGDALYVEKSESASGIIYFTGSTYSWYQQGD